MKHDHQIQVENLVKERFAFLKTDWGFGKPKCKHWSLLTQCKFSSDTLEIEIDVDWRDVIPDVVILKKGETKRHYLFHFSPEIKELTGEDPSYFSPRRFENLEELLRHLEYLSRLLKTAMPVIVRKLAA
ncbi:MAG: hypothetical protein AAB316_05025 [Bacteroidota bacterium]